MNRKMKLIYLVLVVITFNVLTACAACAQEPTVQVKGKLVNKNTGQALRIKPDLFFIYPQEIAGDEKEKLHAKLQNQEINSEIDDSGTFLIEVINPVRIECALIVGTNIVTPVFEVSPGKVVDLGTIEVKR